MGESIDRRERRVRVLVALGKQLADQGLAWEEVRTGIRRHVLVAFGGSVNTVNSLVQEALAKIEYEREKESLRIHA